jgi:hypothetical protein
MMTTWIDVADSAVKIGLGALLGGWFGFANAKLAHEREAIIEFVKSRRDILKDAIQRCDTFSRAHADYWAALFDALEDRTERGKVPKKFVRSLKQKEKVLRDAFQDFAHIESCFLLAGEQGLYTTFREYAAACDKFFRDAHLENPQLTSAEMLAYGQQFKSLRLLIGSGIGEAFCRSGIPVDAKRIQLPWLRIPDVAHRLRESAAQRETVITDRMSVSPKQE